MTEGAKLVTSRPNTEVKDERETADTNRPVALVGVSHEHLESQRSGETKSDKNEEKQKNVERGAERPAIPPER